MPVPSLLQDAPPVAEDCALTTHLVNHCPFDGPEGVYVLGFGTGTQWSIRVGPKREVNVCSHVAAFHPGLRNSKSTENVAKFTHVGAGNLWCALSGSGDGPGNDLHQRDACPIVIN